MDVTNKRDILRRYFFDKSDKSTLNYYQQNKSIVFVDVKTIDPDIRKIRQEIIDTAQDIKKIEQEIRAIEQRYDYKYNELLRLKEQKEEINEKIKYFADNDRNILFVVIATIIAVLFYPPIIVLFFYPPIKMFCILSFYIFILFIIGILIGYNEREISTYNKELENLIKNTDQKLKNLRLNLEQKSQRLLNLEEKYQQLLDRDSPWITEIKELFERELKELEKRALDKFGIEESELIRESIHVIGLIGFLKKDRDIEYDSSKVSMDDINHIRETIRRGKDIKDVIIGFIGFDSVDVCILHFTQKQILVYKCIWNFVEGKIEKEYTYEYFYKDILSVDIKTDQNGAETFTLTTSGGTTLSVIIPGQEFFNFITSNPVFSNFTSMFPISHAENVVQEIRKILRVMRSE